MLLLFKKLFIHKHFWIFQTIMSSTNNTTATESVSAQQLAEQEHLFLHYESQGGAGPPPPPHELPAHLLQAAHGSPEADIQADHQSPSHGSKEGKRNGHGKSIDFTSFQCLISTNVLSDTTVSTNL